MAATLERPSVSGHVQRELGWGISLHGLGKVILSLLLSRADIRTALALEDRVEGYPDHKGGRLFVLGRLASQSSGGFACLTLTLFLDLLDLLEGIQSLDLISALPKPGRKFLHERVWGQQSSSCPGRAWAWMSHHHELGVCSGDQVLNSLPGELDGLAAAVGQRPMLNTAEESPQSVQHPV